MPLPFIDNPLNFDVERIAEAFKILDKKIEHLQNEVKYLSDPWNAFPWHTPVSAFNVKFPADPALSRHPIFSGDTEPRMNWVICDGGSDLQGGTVPDLRGRFIMGADGGILPYNYGGSRNLSGSISGTAAGNSNNTTISINQMPSHNHMGNSQTNWTGGGSKACSDILSSTVDSFKIIAYQGGSQGHLHWVNIGVSGSCSITGYLPQYYSMVFVVKLKQAEKDYE